MKSTRGLSKPERSARRGWILAIAIPIAGFFIAWRLVDEPPPAIIRIGTGNQFGDYHRHGLAYSKLLETQGFEVETESSLGSGENIERLTRGDLDLAFVQSGTPVQTKDLVSLATLYLEPLWVFHRSTDIHSLADLRGRRVAIGDHGSGTRTLADRLLALHGLKDDDLQRIEGGPSESLAALQRGEVDLVFFVGGTSMPVIERAFEAGARLLDLKQWAKAYEVQLPHLKSVTLHPGMLDIPRAWPSQPTVMMAATTTLVARRDLHEGLIPPILEAAIAVHSKGGVLESPGEFPTWKWTDLPQDETATRYLRDGPGFLHRVFPHRHAIMIDRLKVLLVPLITLLFPLIRIAPPLYRWRTRAKIYRWYETLAEIEFSLTNGQREPAAESLQKIEREIEVVSVPLGYMWELYSLRTHIAFVRSHWDLPRKALPGDAETAPPASQPDPSA